MQIVSSLRRSLTSANAINKINICMKQIIAGPVKN